MAVSVVKEENYSTLKIIGKSVQRIDALPKVKGQAKYADDETIKRRRYQVLFKLW